MRKKNLKEKSKLFDLKNMLYIASHLHLLGDLQQSENIFRQILRIQPNNVDALHGLGILEYGLGNNNKALELIVRAIKLKPNDAFMYNSLGRVLKDSGKLADSLSFFQRATELNPDIAEFYINLSSLNNLARPIDVEKAEEIFYINYLDQGIVVFDIGANIGYLSLLFAKFIGNKGKVYSFEAANSVFKRLETIIQLSMIKNINIFNYAVSDREGFINLNVYDDECSVFNSMANRPMENYGLSIKPNKIEEVKYITIDQFCSENNIEKIDLLKIDVEGAELQVLLGTRNMLEQKRIKCIVFEFGPTTFDMGNNPDEIESYLDKFGYKIKNIVKGDTPFPRGNNINNRYFSMHVASSKI